MAKPARRCIDCAAEGVTTKRPAPHPGPRCATHHRLVRGERRDRAWAKRIEATYGITTDEYWAILAHQGGVCPLCRRAKGVARRLAVEHDHASGEVRAIACGPCNKILGHARDDIEFFRRCVDYLENPPARAVIGRRVVPGHSEQE
mgnify:CR=1 FL=1